MPSSQAILTAIAFSAERLVRARDWQEVVPNVLQRVGKATVVSRAYLFQFTRSTADDVFVSQRFEWTAPGIRSEADNPVLQEFGLRSGGFQRWVEAFERGEPVHGPISTFPDSEHALLEAQEIRTLGVFPVLIGGRWWGFIGFDDCVREREWSRNELEALTLVANLVAAAIEREAAEHERDQLAQERITRAELEAERENLLDLFRDAPAIMALLEGPDLVFTLANTSYVKATGKGDVTGRSVREVFPEVEGSGLLEALEQVFETGEPFIGEEVPVLLDRAGDGSLDERFFSFVNQAHRDPHGRISGVFVQGIDVTEHVRARRRAEELAESATAERMRLQQIIDVLPEAIAIGDEHGGIILSNAAAREIWGQEAGPETDIDHYDIFGVLRPDGTPWPSRELPGARAVLRGELVLGEQLLLRNATTDELQPLLVNAAPLRDPSGRITGAVNVFQDISALKELERQKDEFLGTISHDLKGPLTSIRGYAARLRRQFDKDDPLLQPLEEIERSVVIAAEMLDELLDVARLQMGRPIELNREETDLVQLAGQVADQHRSVSDDHTIEVLATEDRLLGSWDAKRLQRALANLVENAIKYSPQGGAVRIEIGGSEHEVVIAVQDDGIGIASTDLPHLFDRFRRGSNVTPGIEGMGIGLAVVRQIVQQHSGDVSVQSEAGKGSVFTIRLPIHPPTVEA